MRTPESFLTLARRDSARGNLKVYLGMAAGVGKTWRMLDDAHAMRSRGIDVVIGYVEPHGRAETTARIGDLEVIPRTTIHYKDVVLEEMDLDGCIRRRPDVLIVDELPHTNAPGCRHEKRWQDVEEILGSGISVMTAMNVQHLEGVQDVVRSATGIDIRERVPDRFVREATSLVLVDLPVAELQERLRQGKIYPPDQSRRALENFFRTEMLVKLRELALLQTADYSSRDAPLAEEAGGIPRIAVALPFDPVIARALILRGSRLAGRMNTRWLALYVRRKRDQAENMSATEHHQLTDNVQLAMSLGASVVIRESEDVVGTILEFVRQENVSLLLAGRPSRRGLFSRVAPGIVQRLQNAKGFDLMLIDVDSPAPDRRESVADRRP
jgi:two-component system sensor histidine kinase KdpD